MLEFPELEDLAAGVVARHDASDPFDERQEHSACAVEGCCALPVDDSPLCSIHSNVTRRKRTDCAIHCYACGELIRIGQRWNVRAEGAFHLNAQCLNLAPNLWRPWKGRPHNPKAPRR